MKISSHSLTILAAAGMLSITALSTTQAEIVTTDLGFATVEASDDATQDATAWLDQRGSPWIDSSTNLLQTHLLSASYFVWGNGSKTRLDYLHDGLLVSGSGVNGDESNLSLFSDEVAIQFELDGSYDIAIIDSFTNWNGARNGQAYTISTSTDGGATWNSLYSVDVGNVASPGHVIRGVSTADSTAGTAMAKGVNAILIEINDFTGSGGDNAVYAEFAIYAAPVHPGKR